MGLSMALTIEDWGPKHKPIVVLWEELQFRCTPEFLSNWVGSHE